MKAVITADIINSTKWSTDYWMPTLKSEIKKHGSEGKDWEIYRGDELQLLIEKAEDVFLTALKIKIQLKKKSLDARISIGLGEIDFLGKNIKESNGSAFTHSGRNLEELKNGKTQSLSIKSGNENLDENLNLIFLLLEPTFEKWTENSAKALYQYLNSPELNQQEISEKLGITQGALSRALKRANLEGILETDKFFRKKISEI